MPTAIIFPKTKVDWNSLSTHWTGWGKTQDDAFSCRLTMSFTYVVERFSDYWNALLIRESEEDGLPVEGYYADLQELSWPCLETMLNAHPLLFSSLIMEDLPSDFVGCMLQPPSSVAHGIPCYFLTSLTGVDVISEHVEITGLASPFPVSQRT
jgi:hypothetical protein